jgi:NAD(P)-dependent dehydrogenase (short-subunit alcohol dehydrogenase family)
VAERVDYKGKRVIVSGCFSGRGEATARQLLQLGAEVHGLDYKPTPAEQAAPLVFLNSGAAGFINGLAMSVDGGFIGDLATGRIDARSLMGAAAGAPARA